VTTGCRLRAPNAKVRGRPFENCHWACRTNKGLRTFKSARRDDEETVRVGLAGCTRDLPCASWGSRLPTSMINGRRLGLARVVQRPGKARGSAGRDRRMLQKNAAQNTINKLM